MSSPNIITAAASASKRTKTLKLKLKLKRYQWQWLCFDAVEAALLCERLLSISILPPTAKTVCALVNTTHKHLKSSFSDSIGVGGGSARSKPETTSAPLPPITLATSVGSSRICVTQSTTVPGIAAPSQKLSQTSPVKYPSLLMMTWCSILMMAT